MNVKELKEKIKDLPDNMDVMIEQSNDEFQLSGVETANVGEVQFKADGIPADEWAEIDCLILRD